MKTMQSARSLVVCGFVLSGSSFVAAAGCAAKTLPAETPEVDASVSTDGAADAASCNMASPVESEATCKEAGCDAILMKRTSCVGPCDNQPKTLTICRDKQSIVGLLVTCWREIATGDRYETMDTGLPLSYTGFRICQCGTDGACRER
jgi:hypothetical protein